MPFESKTCAGATGLIVRSIVLDNQEIHPRKPKVLA